MGRASERWEFRGAAGGPLSGILETRGGDEDVRGRALFAHCFTCSKHSHAAARVSRGLAAAGIATLRFDFAGIGDSGGEFEETGFSSNIGDLLAAAAAMRDRVGAPDLLIGHSLGGAAVLAAAAAIPECRGVVTIGAPSDPGHLAAALARDHPEVREQGESVICIGGRSFVVRRELLEDLESHPLLQRLGELRRALLILHSPRDELVGIEHAAALFTAARHPKSFISLDTADHLLSNRADAEYVVDVVTAWAGRYLGPGAAPGV